MRRPDPAPHRPPIKAAGYPGEKWVGAFGFDDDANVNPATIHTLATAAWAHRPAAVSDWRLRHRQVPSADWAGDCGPEVGFRVKHTLATRLVNEHVQAADEMTLNRTIVRYGRVDLLCIDELGYMELDKCGAELLFRVLTEREETSSVAIASNASFCG